MVENKFLKFGEDLIEKDGPVEEGEYEVTLENIEKKVGKASGKEYLSVTFKIRSDVDQPSKNRKLWFNIIRNEDDACWNFNKINRLVCTQGGQRREFETFDEILQFLCGINLRIKVGKVYDDKYQREVNTISERDFKAPTVAKSAPVPTPTVHSDEVSLPPEDDLPF